MDKLANQVHRGSNISEYGQTGGLQGNINPLTRKGRTTVFVGLVVLPLLSGIAVVIYSTVQLTQSVISYKHSNNMLHVTEAAMESLELLEAVQEYTTVSSVYTVTEYSGLFGPLTSFSISVAEQAAEMLPWHESMEVDLEGLEEVLQSLQQLDGTSSSKSEVVNIAYQYCLNIQWTIIKLISHKLMENPFDAWYLKSPLIEVVQGYASLGLEKGMTTMYYLVGNLTSVEYLTFIEHKAISQEHLQIAMLQSNLVDKAYAEQIAKYPSMLPGIYESQNLVMRNAFSVERMYEGLATYYKYGALQKVLKEVLQNLLEHIETLTEEEKGSSVNVIIYSSFKIMAVLFIMVPFIVISASRNMKSLVVYSITIERNNLELKREKRKIDNILNQMLPKAVAYKLRRGQTIAAEEYEQATIFFSDIDDFDDISTHSSPMQIVTFLNDIYNFMDNQLERYDVYKVETIGCVYMVVSGLPMRNGNRHVSEIARMALDILYTTQNFVIAHILHKELLIRIGIHSGPVVAGVIGNITPRYCLFGDSVNTASRMQSNGLARKIHISKSFKESLERIGGFVCEERGLVEIKGKGLMTTYWLEGRHDTKNPSISVSGTEEGSLLCVE